MNYSARIKKLLKSREMFAWDAFLITHPTDIYYFTGVDLSAGKLLITKDATHLIVDGRYFEACKNTNSISLHLAKEGLLFQLLKGIKTLAINSETTSTKNYLDLQKEADKHGIVVQPFDDLINKIRAIKDPDELKLLIEAAELGAQGFDHIRSLLKEGIQESELALEIENFWKKKGAKGVAFEPIIAFGANSALPHYRAGSSVLKKDEIVLIDVGVLNHHYHSDMTRVIFFGNVDEKLKKIRQIVADAMQAAFSILKSGVATDAVDAAARDYITSHGYGEQFTHSTGHGVGLDIHEFPTLRKKTSGASVILEAGMVITIEPGIYLPGLGGVRLEDTVVITETGYENLTHRDYAYL